LELKIEGMGTYGHVLIQIFSAKTAVCPLNIKNHLKIFIGKKKDSVATTKHLCIVNTPQFTNLHNLHTFVLASVQTKCKIIFKTPKTTLHGD
jgi:hypothetical protein